MNVLRQWMTSSSYVLLRSFPRPASGIEPRFVVAFASAGAPRYGSSRARVEASANPKKLKKHFKYRSCPGSSRKPRLSFTTLSAEAASPPDFEIAAPEERDAVAAVFERLVDAGINVEVWPPDVDATAASLTLQLLRSKVSVENTARFLSDATIRRRLLDGFSEEEVFEIVKTLTNAEICNLVLLNVLHHAGGRVFDLGVERLVYNLEALRRRRVSAEQLVAVLQKSPAALVDFSATDWDARQEWFAFNFAARHFVETLQHQPQVLTDRLEDIERKFNYVFFRMGLDQKQMLECKLFSHSFHRIKCRHQFLKRSGIYKYPDPKRRVLNLNPHLEKILDWDDLKFLSQVPGAELKHYRVFSKMVALEAEEDDDVDADSDGEDSDQEDEESLKNSQMQQSGGLRIKLKRKSR